MRIPVIALVLLAVSATAIRAGEAPAPAPTPTPTPARGDDRPQLGVQIDERSAFDKGLPVLHVVPGSTAAAMGMQIGDRIMAINGTAMASIPDLQTTLAALKIGDPITIDIVRGEAKQTLAGTMQRSPSIRRFTDEVAQMRQELEDLRRGAGVGKKEPSLAEVLQMLAEVEKQLPKAVAEFKKQYPDGEFDIEIKIKIVSDKNAKDPIDLVPPGDEPAEDDAPKPKKDAPKP